MTYKHWSNNSLIKDNWSPDNFKAVPYQQSWTANVKQAIRNALATEPPLKPYDAYDLLEVLTLAYGFRGLTLSTVEAHLPSDMPSPAVRKAYYLRQMKAANAIAVDNFLQQSGVTVETLEGMPTYDFEQHVLCHDVDNLIAFLVHSGVSRCNKHYIVNNSRQWATHDAEQRLTLAINWCLEQQLLKKYKADEFGLTPKAKTFAEIRKLHWRDPATDTEAKSTTVAAANVDFDHEGKVRTDADGNPLNFHNRDTFPIGIGD